MIEKKSLQIYLFSKEATFTDLLQSIKLILKLNWSYNLFREKGAQIILAVSEKVIPLNIALNYN